MLTQQEVPYRVGHDIGIGIDMATGSPMGMGVEGDLSPPKVGTGSSEEFVFRRIETTNDLEDELSFGADVSGGIGLFSADASFHFAKRCKVQASSLTVLLSCRKTFAFQQVDSPSLTEEARKKVGDPDGFAAQFGNYFVRGVGSGGRFLGVLRFDTKDQQSKRTLDTAFSGSYGMVVDADVTAAITSAVTSTEARAEAFVFVQGGVIKTHPKSNNPVVAVDQLFASMDEWLGSVPGDPQAYLVSAAPYAIATGATPPNTAQLETQRTVLVRCARLRGQTLDKLNLVEYILDPQHTDEFEITAPPAGPDLPALQATLAGDLDSISDAASYAISNAASAVEPETYMRTIGGRPDFTFTSLPADMPKQRPGTTTSPAQVGPGWTKRATTGLPPFRGVATVRGGSSPAMIAMLVAADGTLWKADDASGDSVVQQPGPGTLVSVSGPAMTYVDEHGTIWRPFSGAAQWQPQQQFSTSSTGGSPIVSAQFSGLLYAVTADGRAWAEQTSITHHSAWLPMDVGAPVTKVLRATDHSVMWALPTSGGGLFWRDGSGWHPSQPFACSNIGLDAQGTTLWMLADDGTIWTTKGNPDARVRVSDGDFIALAGGLGAHTAIALDRQGAIWDFRAPG